MGDKKKKREKDKKKSKRRDSRRSHKDRDSSSSQSSSSSSDSRSERSRSRDKHKRSKKRSSKKESTKTATPYNFEATPKITTPMPRIPGMPMQPIPPPMPTTPASVTIPKAKTKEVNIFKLLPKLNYGPLLFAKTLYSTQFVDQIVYRRLLKEVCADLQRTAQEEGHKKGLQFIHNCMTDLEKAAMEQQAGDQAKADYLLSNQTNNQYQMLQRQFAKIKHDVDSYLQQ